MPQAATRTTASPGPGSGAAHLVDPDVVGPVHSYLQHGQVSVRSRRGRNRNDMASRMAVATTSKRTPKSLRW